MFILKIAFPAFCFAAALAAYGLEEAAPLRFFEIALGILHHNQAQLRSGNFSMIILDQLDGTGHRRYGRRKFEMESASLKLEADTSLTVRASVR